MLTRAPFIPVFFAPMMLTTAQAFASERAIPERPDTRVTA